MFARGNIAAASLAHNKINETNEKTDEELMAEIEADLAENEGLDDLDILKKEEEKYKEQFQGFWLLELFGVVCWKCHMLVHGPYAPPFNILIMLAIVMAGILVGVETYDEYSSDPSVQALDYFVVSIFGFDVLVKIGVEGIRPWNFFFGEHGRWNTFDFFIVLICMPHISDVFGNSSATIRLVSRLFRLFRVGKIIEQIPALQVIVTGLIGGLKSILYVALLLLIIFFIWGVFGVYLFHANDPFYFRDLPTALITLFRVCTLEGWSDVMYTNIYGCDVYDAGLYMVRSDVNSTADWHAIPNFWRCENPVAQPEISGAFFISFTLVASLVMLQLFIGVITIQMQDSLAKMRKESEAVSRKKLLMKQVREMKGMAKKEAALQIARAMISMQSSDEHEHGHGHGHGGKSNIHNRGLNEALASHLAALDYQESDSDSDSDSSGDEDESAATWRKSFLGRLWRRAKRFADHFRGSRKNEDGTVNKYMTHKEKRKMRDMAEMRALLMQAWSKTEIARKYHHELDAHQVGTLELYIRWAGVYARAIIEDDRFQNFITTIILFTAVLVGLGTDNDNTTDPVMSSFLDVSENIVYAIFVVEVALRLAAEEFHLNEYFANTWNVFDFSVVLLSKMPGVGSFTFILRVVRLLRVLKLLKFLPQLAVIVNALLMALSSIGYILLILFLTYYLYAVLGIIFFRENDHGNFGTLTRALVALYKMATLDNWGLIMYANIYGCDQYPSQKNYNNFIQSQCDTPKGMFGIAVIYCVSFIVIGAFVMITLFVGVVTTSMEEATKMQIVEMNIEMSIHEVCNEKSISQEQLDIYRRVFGMLDLDGGGTIEPAELEIGLKCINIRPTPKQMEKWVREVDVNFDGVIDLVEFIVFMTNMKKKNMEARERQLMRMGANAFFRARDRARRRQAEEQREQRAKERQFAKDSGTSLDEKDAALSPDPDTNFQFERLGANAFFRARDRARKRREEEQQDSEDEDDEACAPPPLGTAPASPSGKSSKSSKSGKSGKGKLKKTGSTFFRGLGFDGHASASSSSSAPPVGGLRGLGRQASVRLRGLGQSIQETGEAVALAVTRSLNEGSTLEATRRRRMSVSRRVEAAKVSAAAAAEEAKEKEKAGNKGQKKKEKSWSDSDSDDDIKAKAKAKDPAGVKWVSSTPSKDEEVEEAEANLAIRTKAGPPLPAAKHPGAGAAFVAATSSNSGSVTDAFNTHTNTNIPAPAAAATVAPGPQGSKEDVPQKPQGGGGSLSGTVDLTSSLTPSLSVSWGADDCSVDNDEAVLWAHQAARQEQLRQTRSLFRK